MEASTSLTGSFFWCEKQLITKRVCLETRKVDHESPAGGGEPPTKSGLMYLATCVDFGVFICSVCNVGKGVPKS